MNPVMTIYLISSHSIISQPTGPGAAGGTEVHNARNPKLGKLLQSQIAEIYRSEMCAPVYQNPSLSVSLFSLLLPLVCFLQG
jgi:hypothetical protein